MNREKRRFLLMTTLLLGLLVADRALKVLATRLFDIHGRALIPGVLEFKLFTNTGIAFSLPFSGPLLWILSLILIAAFAALALRPGRTRRFSMMTCWFLLFLFGALSNLYDRVLLGYTIDYLIFFGRSAVNLADGMIIAGAAALIWNAKKEARGLSSATQSKA